MLLPVITETYAAEPISAHSFISNANGYPILPKTTQSLVRGLLMAVPTISFVLSHTDTGLHAKEGGEAYRQYVNQLIRTTQAREEDSSCRSRSRSK